MFQPSSRPIYELLPADHAAAYRVEQASHCYPCSEKIFLTHHGKTYFNFKVVENHRLIGFAITQIVADEASLLDIAIHPAVQRRGYGQQLLSHLIEKLQARACVTLWLEVRVSNFKALALYEQHAFTQVSIRYNYYPSAHGREDAIILARTL